MNSFKQIILLFLLTIVLSSCAVQQIELVRVEDFKVKSFNSKGASVEVKARIKNPNKFGFKVKGSDLNLFVGNNEVGKVTLKDKIKIKPNAEETYTFVLQSDLAKLAGNALMGGLGMLTQGSLNVKVKGDLKIGKAFVTKRIPVNIEEKVSPASLLGL